MLIEFISASVAIQLMESQSTLENRFSILMTQNRGLRTPLHYADLNQAIKLLEGFSPDQRGNLLEMADESGWTALYYGDDRRVAVLLVGLGSDKIEKLLFDQKIGLLSRELSFCKGLIPNEGQRLIERGRKLINSLFDIQEQYKGRFVGTEITRQDQDFLMTNFRGMIKAHGVTAVDKGFGI